MHVSDPALVKTVLIVEDDADIAEVLTIFLHEATPYQAIHASNGFAALKIVQTIIPQLIVLDYRLPNMDGLECLDQLRKNSGMERTPVILMSAALPKGGQMLERVQARSNLILLEKPFELDALLPLIRQFLEES